MFMLMFDSWDIFVQVLKRPADEGLISGPLYWDKIKKDSNNNKNWQTEETANLYSFSLVNQSLKKF